MSDECKIIDPTAYGLFVVALVSLPLAIWGFMSYGGMTEEAATLFAGVPSLLTLGGAFILIASLLAYRAGSNFGFIVFALVAFGVIYAGWGSGDLYINIVLGIMYLICLIWSLRAHTLKTLTLILLTTALVFFANGCCAGVDGDWPTLFMGIAAILNFILTLYLAFALADERIPCY